MQNRPFHIKEGKVEELDKTATNVILSTLFLENSVNEYEILYFKEIDKVLPFPRRSASTTTSATRRSWPTWSTSSTRSTSRSSKPPPTRNSGPSTPSSTYSLHHAGQVPEEREGLLHPAVQDTKGAEPERVLHGGGQPLQDGAADRRELLRHHRLKHLQPVVLGRADPELQAHPADLGVRAQVHPQAGTDQNLAADR